MACYQISPASKGSHWTEAILIAYVILVIFSYLDTHEPITSRMEIVLTGLSSIVWRVRLVERRHGGKRQDLSYLEVTYPITKTALHG